MQTRRAASAPLACAQGLNRTLHPTLHPTSETPDFRTGGPPRVCTRLTRSGVFGVGAVLLPAVASGNYSPSPSADDVCRASAPPAEPARGAEAARDPALSQRRSGLQAPCRAREGAGTDERQRDYAGQLTKHSPPATLRACGDKLCIPQAEKREFSSTGLSEFWRTVKCLGFVHAAKGIDDRSHDVGQCDGVVFATGNLTLVNLGKGRRILSNGIRCEV